MPLPGRKATMIYFCRNYRDKIGEADITQRMTRCLLFVEVKTRRITNSESRPRRLITINSRESKKVAMSYTDTINNDIRFDVIEVFYAPVYDTAVR